MYRHLIVGCASLALLACSGQRDSAQKLLLDTDATIIAASAEAAQYVPQQLAEVRRQYVALQAAYDQQDYAGVVATAPGVLSAAQTLATAAAAEKDQRLKVLNDEWTRLATTLPEDAAAIENRIELLSQPANKKLAAGADLDAARAALSDDLALWSKATAAFAAGNLDEAVSAAKAVEAKFDPLAAALKVILTPPPPPPPPPAAA